LKRTYRAAALGLLISLCAFVIFRSRKPFFPRLSDAPISESKLNNILLRSESALEKNPLDSTALVDRGVANFHMGMSNPDYYDDAFNSLTEARTRGAFDTRIFYYLGVLYENISVFDESEKQYRRFLNHHPKDREIRLRLARLDYRMGKWEESIDQYKLLLEENPEDVTTLINLGLANRLRYKSEYKLNKRRKKKKRVSKDVLIKYLDEGIDYLERAQMLNPQSAEGVYLSLSRMYIAKKEWEKAVSSAQSEITQYPGENDVDAYTMQVIAYRNLKKDVELLETYQKWIKLEPGNKRIKRKIKKLKKRLKL